MKSPDERLFDDDLRSGEFQIGAESGAWGAADPAFAPADLPWPHRVLWISPAARPNSPERFYIKIDVAGYPAVSPTGAFWDSVKLMPLETAKWPKGKEGSRFARIFRTDWMNAVAFYHPYDRFAFNGHQSWVTDLPHLVWTAEHTIVDYLSEFQELLNSEDYLGVEV